MSLICSLPFSVFAHDHGEAADAIVKVGHGTYAKAFSRIPTRLCNGAMTTVEVVSR